MTSNSYSATYYLLTYVLTTSVHLNQDAKKKKPPTRSAPKGDMMDEYLSVKDDNMKLKRAKAENDQRMKECV